jgi:hypothetical protein
MPVVEVVALTQEQQERAAQGVAAPVTMALVLQERLILEAVVVVAAIFQVQTPAVQVVQVLSFFLCQRQVILVLLQVRQQ